MSAEDDLINTYVMHNQVICLVVAKAPEPGEFHVYGGNQWFILHRSLFDPAPVKETQHPLFKFLTSGVR